MCAGIGRCSPYIQDWLVSRDALYVIRDFARWRTIMTRLVTDLIIRVCIVTLIYSVISYFLVRSLGSPAAAVDVLLLFVLFGVVILSILYGLFRYHVADATA